jgi:hypothetical protein
MMINWWFLAFDATNMFDHFWMFAFIFIVILHVGDEPIVHFVFGNLTIVISITLFNSSINILLWDKSAISIQGSSCCLLVNGQGHSDEAPGFFLVQGAVSIFVVL